MIPTNFALIEMNEERGGKRSASSAGSANARSSSPHSSQKRSAEDSVAGKGEGDEFTDLSGPQPRTERETTKEDDERVRELLGRFGVLNGVRGVLIGVGGVVGLVTALA